MSPRRLGSGSQESGLQHLPVGPLTGEADDVCKATFAGQYILARGMRRKLKEERVRRVLEPLLATADFDGHRGQVYNLEFRRGTRALFPAEGGSDRSGAREASDQDILVRGM